MLITLKNKITKTVLNLKSSTKNIIIADDSTKGKTAVFANLRNYSIRIDGQSINQMSYFYGSKFNSLLIDAITDSVIANSEKDYFNNLKILKNKKLIIFDDLESNVYINFIRKAMSYYPDTHFIIISRRFTYKNTACYTLRNRELKPYLLKQDIPLVDYYNYKRIIVEDSEYSISNIKNYSGKLWDSLTTSNIEVVYAKSNSKIEQNYNSYSCVSVDYCFDNINTLSLIKKFIKCGINICNYYTTEMLYLLAIDNSKVLNHSDLEMLHYAILNENIPYEYPEKYAYADSTNTFEKRLKTLLGIISSKDVIIPPRELKLKDNVLIVISRQS